MLVWTQHALDAGDAEGHLTKRPSPGSACSHCCRTPSSRRVTENPSSPTQPILADLILISQIRDGLQMRKTHLETSFAGMRVIFIIILLGISAIFGSSTRRQRSLL